MPNRGAHYCLAAPLRAGVCHHHLPGARVTNLSLSPSRPVDAGAPEPAGTPVGTGIRKAARCFALAAGALLVAAPAPSLAQDPGAWKWRAALYGYFPGVSANVSLPPPIGGGSTVEVDAGTILDNLTGAFMGALEAHNGRWGLFTDVLHVSVGASKSGFTELAVGGRPIPIGAVANARYDLRSTLWTVGGAYRVSQGAGPTIDVVGGVRMLDVRQSLSWDLSGNVGAIDPPVRSGARSGDLTNWDAFVGLRGRAVFGDGDRWFAPFHFDFGAGSSRLHWQALGGIGYRFDRVEVIAAWRHIDYDMKSGKTIRSMSISGPAVAVVIDW
jgi:hypothetical protein